MRCGRYNRDMGWLEYFMEGCVEERRRGWARKRLLEESGDGIKEMKEIGRRKVV